VVLCPVGKSMAVGLHMLLAKFQLILEVQVGDYLVCQMCFVVQVLQANCSSGLGSPLCCSGISFPLW
jgi:hypothetical protein